MVQDWSEHFLTCTGYEFKSVLSIGLDPLLTNVGLSKVAKRPIRVNALYIRLHPIQRVTV